ncbi:MAG: lipoprotein signal peptidase [Pedobacter agri]|uniref:Lipoprotein signal peptidase n=1 Tax=Pedobacter agri TaxID=454586 RepID=A0A9X3DIF0_9SPHI|nr:MULTISPECIES: lipoprotein signal peptidase [Pedobacter]AZI24333.1 lipoprotein signal peptidase [Pedobacter sp. G11]MCX3265893.1 lipoprotein signal peptidase [Pedobacter agri]MDQ1140197.1 signal peptidase II [Pedobacter agri]RYD71817.1 MAG: lipoprotein signal peptidase [Sphingobacteriales bacterium]
MKGYTKPLIIIFLVLLADQLIKTWVKTNMYLGQEFNIIGKWFIIHFTENNGMAFGMEFGGEFGKLALSLFRIAAVGGIGYGLHYLIKHKYHRGLILNVALIFSGALGNIIDSVFYGKIYGYETWFHGRVVDMFYFPIAEGHFPSWIPIWGGDEFIFFRPVFNLADAAISVGVILILIFQKNYFKEDVKDDVGINSEIVED